MTTDRRVKTIFVSTLGTEETLSRNNLILLYNSYNMGFEVARKISLNASHLYIILHELYDYHGCLR